MKAFNGNQFTKDQFISRLKDHRRAGDLKQNERWSRETGIGSAIGCTVHSEDAREFERQLGIPEPLARLANAIFNSLPEDEALQWPENFLSSIKPGARLTRVCDSFMVWLLTDSQRGVKQFAVDESVQAEIAAVADLYKLGTSDAAGWERAVDHAHRIVSACTPENPADARAIDALVSAVFQDPLAASHSVACAFALKRSDAQEAHQFSKERAAEFSLLARKLIELISAVDA